MNKTRKLRGTNIGRKDIKISLQKKGKVLTSLGAGGIFLEVIPGLGEVLREEAKFEGDVSSRLISHAVGTHSTGI